MKAGWSVADELLRDMMIADLNSSGTVGSDFGLIQDRNQSY